MPPIQKQPEEKIIQQNFIKQKTQQKLTKPAVNKSEKKQPAVEKIELEYPLKAPSEIKPAAETKRTPQSSQQQEVPSKEQLPLYDWNLKNIYLKEIGTQTFYEKQAAAGEKL